MTRFISPSSIVVFVLVAVHSVVALDVEVVGVTCDESLPVTADLKLKDCVAGSRCTFGQEATVYGSLVYSGVENSGIENNLAYVTADLSLWTISFNLLDMMPVPLCDETMVADESNANACPGDGIQNYEVVYKLPSAGAEHTSWLASGWDGSGLIQMFAQQDKSMLIGECTLQLKTFVTRPEGERKSLLSTPSAAATVGIVLGAVAVAALLMAYCYCCCSKRRKSNKTAKEEDEESRFQRMEEEKSYWSGAGSRRSKKSMAATKSVKSIDTSKKETESDTVVSELPLNE